MKIIKNIKTIKEYFKLSEKKANIKRIEYKKGLTILVNDYSFLLTTTDRADKITLEKASYTFEKDIIRIIEHAGALDTWNTTCISFNNRRLITNGKYLVAIGEAYAKLGTIQKSSIENIEDFENKTFFKNVFYCKGLYFGRYNFVNDNYIELLDSIDSIKNLNLL